MRLTAAAVILSLVCLPFTGVGGCSKEPYAAAGIRQIDDSDVQMTPVLDREDQRQILDAFAELSSGHFVVDPPASSSPIRWADVHIALLAACDDSEMAVVQRIKHEWGYEYRILTVEDFPGTFVVRRTHDPRVYQADARIGRFDDKPERAKQLLRAFDRQMRLYGKKRVLGDS